MKKLLLTSFLITGLLLPATFQASNNESSNKLEFSSSKTKKKKKKRKSRRTTASNNGCTYQGHKLYVGERGGCYYYSGNSKEYVERSYCSGCN